MVYYIQPSLGSIEFRLFQRRVYIYVHWRGVFGVARFDLSGNARAFIAWNEQQTGFHAFLYVFMSKFRQQGRLLAVFVNGISMNILQNNPYRLLGVYSNSSTKERLANHNRMKAFLKVGKPVSFPLDLPQYLSAVNRTESVVADADARLTLPKDQMGYA